MLKELGRGAAPPQPDFLRRRVPEMRLDVEAFPLRLDRRGGLPLSLRQTLAVHCRAHCWLGCELSLGSPRADRAPLLAPFLLLHSRAVGAYLKAGLECRSDAACFLEAARDAAGHEWRYRARLFGAAPRLRFELLGKGLGGVLFSAKGARTDLGLLWRRRWGAAFAELRATFDVNARAALAPALKARLGARLAPYAEARLQLRADGRRLAARAELALEAGGLPLLASVEAREALVVWLGARFSGATLRMPVWALDWRGAGRADAAFALGALAGLAAALWWARRAHRRALAAAEERHQAREAAKLQQDAVLRQREAAGEAGVSVLFAAVGPRAALSDLLYAAFPWSAATLERAGPRFVDVTATFNFYADEKGLDLPADKTQLLGYLRPPGEQQLHLLVVFRRRGAPRSEPPLRKLFEEDQRLSL